MNKKFYITTPIYYVNDVPHIGHAYTSIAADVMARYKRMRGYDVAFLTGTDEHGQKVASSAEKKDMSPDDFTDFYSGKFREMSDRLNISYTKFMRTTYEDHKASATALWNKLYEAGHIYLGSYSGWYSMRDEAYYAESELIDGKAPTGAPVEWLEEPSYFFNLSQWGDKLLGFYKDNPDFIWPNGRYNEVIRFVESGLKDLSVSRTTFSWGVKVPQDESHVMYVWIEALSVYLSGIGYPDKNLYGKYWPCDMHFMGKDIVRFHGVYWPAILMAAGIEPPKQVVAHGWWTNEGQKISKSLGNVIDPYDLVADLGLDQTRYVLMREVPFGNDGNYSRLSAVRRINAELSNNIGNLMQRTISFIHKNSGGIIKYTEYYQHNILKSIKDLSDKYHGAMENKNFSDAIDAIVAMGNVANIYIDEQAPWKLKNSNIQKMEEVLSILVHIIKDIAILLTPFIPESSSKMMDILNINPEDAYDLLCISLPDGHKLNEPYVVFPRLEENI